MESLQLPSAEAWRPLMTSRWYRRPEPGQLIGYERAVWRVEAVEDLPQDEWEDSDRAQWEEAGMPEPGSWPARPYRFDVTWLGGVRPEWTGDGGTGAHVLVSAGLWLSWDVYPGDRWPQCSCCGEPMPCRGELQERQIGADLDEVARLEKIPPGGCWACAEPITARQKQVTYPGENLDLPGGQEPCFHTRQACRYRAEEYERRWIAVDPRRERVLTWPPCPGILVIHADGSSECRSGRAPFGGERVSQQGCAGHLTHDHTIRQACYVGGDWMNPTEWEGETCPRGCSPDDHPGTATTPRPERRTADGVF